MDDDATKIITSRRSYEFGIDTLRLTMLTLPQVREVIQRTFQFQALGVGKPQATFGNVPDQIPGGLVANFGAVESTGTVAPIRFLHIEPYRIVFDVAGPTHSVITAYEQLRKLLTDLRSPDGSPALGDPIRTRDFSVVTMPLPFDAEELLHPKLRKHIRHMFAAEGVQRSMKLVPQITVGISPSSGALPLEPIGDEPAYELSPRQGIQLGDHVYFSAAPLDSETHIQNLHEMAAAFAPK